MRRETKQKKPPGVPSTPPEGISAATPTTSTCCWVAFVQMPYAMATSQRATATPRNNRASTFTSAPRLLGGLARVPRAGQRVGRGGIGLHAGLNQCLRLPGRVVGRGRGQRGHVRL